MEFPFITLRYDGLSSENRSDDNMTNQCQPELFGDLDLGKDLANGSASVVLK